MGTFSSGRRFRSNRSVQPTVQQIVLRLQWQRVVRVRDAVCFVCIALKTSAKNLTYNT